MYYTHTQWYICNNIPRLMDNPKSLIPLASDQTRQKYPDQIRPNRIRRGFQHMSVFLKVMLFDNHIINHWHGATNHTLIQTRYLRFWRRGEKKKTLHGYLSFFLFASKLQLVGFYSSFTFIMPKLWTCLFSPLPHLGILQCFATIRALII
jgi:hypothetical protein